MSSVGPVIDNGDGTYTVVITAGVAPGVDRFRVRVDDGIRPVILMPEPRLRLVDPAAMGEAAPAAAARLYPSMPNPLRSTTTLSFELASSAHVALRILDLAGRPVVTLLDTDLLPGRRGTQWAGTDASGRPVASGVYFCELRAGDEIVARKLAVLR